MASHRHCSKNLAKELRSDARLEEGAQARPVAWMPVREAQRLGTYRSPQQTTSPGKKGAAFFKQIRGHRRLPDRTTARESRHEPRHRCIRKTPRSPIASVPVSNGNGAKLSLQLTPVSWLATAVSQRRSKPSRLAPSSSNYGYHLGPIIRLIQRAGRIARNRAKVGHYSLLFIFCRADGRRTLIQCAAEFASAPKGKRRVVRNRRGLCSMMTERPAIVELCTRKIRQFLWRR